MEQQSDPKAKGKAKEVAFEEVEDDGKSGTSSSAGLNRHSFILFTATGLPSIVK